jgi:hypothetical protein
MNRTTYLASIACALISVPTILWGTLSATDAINHHLAYVACLESINLDGIGNPSQICQAKQRNP